MESIEYKNNVFDIIGIAEEELKYTKGNIPINDYLFRRYKTIKEIFDNYRKYENAIITINSKTSKYNNIGVNTIGELKKIAINIFNTHHKSHEFTNNNNKIVVTSSGIQEAIEKIYNNYRQRSFIIEHLIILEHLGIIIEKAKLVNQAYNMKLKNVDVYYWNYYLIILKINGKKYIYSFDIRSMQDGVNQFRVGRIEPIDKKTN